MKTLDEMPKLGWPDKPGFYAVRGSAYDRGTLYTYPKRIIKTLSVKPAYCGDMVDEHTFRYLVRELGEPLEFILLEE